MDKIKCPICNKEYVFDKDSCEICGCNLQKYKEEVENEKLPPDDRFLIPLSLSIFAWVGFLAIIPIVGFDNLAISLPASFILLSLPGGLGTFLFGRLYKKDKDLYKLAEKDSFAAKLQAYKKRKEKERYQLPSEETIIQRERSEVLASQRDGAAPWERKYLIHSCPHCGHYKVRYSNWDDKKVSVAFWGAASDKISKAYKCDHCGNMW